MNREIPNFCDISSDIVRTYPKEQLLKKMTNVAERKEKLQY